MPGEDLEAALDAAAAAAGDHIGSVLTQLGENVTNPAEADAVRDHYLEVLDAIRARRLPAQISVKPTHLGIDIDAEACAERIRTLAAAGSPGHTVWIDMESSSYSAATLRLFREVRAAYENVGLCLQAYLRRTTDDLTALLPLVPAIRVVKGAYHEPPALAYPRKKDVDEEYFRLGSRLLAMQQKGKAARPVLGTHDMALVDRLRARARELGLPDTALEVHMLYGIGTDDQRRLAAEGVPVRVLISYGSAWFPWYVRRLAERPANLWFVLKSLTR
jgi:proline dehydrogenase